MKDDLSLFFLRIFLCFIPFQAFYFIFLPLTIYACFLALFFYHPIISQQTLIINQKSFLFIEACIASTAYWFLWVLTMLTRDIDFITRVKLIFTSFTLFFFMNVLRIVILILISLHYGQAAFDTVHLLFWNFVSGIYLALVWIITIKIHNIHSIPLYDDLKYLYKKSIFTRRSPEKPKYPQ